MVVDRVTPELEQAVHNLDRIELTSSESLNVYQLLRYPRIVLSKAAMEAMQGRLTPRAAKGESA